MRAGAKHGPYDIVALADAQAGVELRSMAGAPLVEETVEARVPLVVRYG